jgi:uncharacterized protein (TIGR02996 family)
LLIKNDMNDEASFIATILAGPTDESRRLEYADWLEERGDARAGYLSAETAWARTRSDRAKTELRDLAVSLDAVWVARVSRPPVGVCADHLQFREPNRTRGRPTLSAADLDWIESRFGLTLPPDYRAFLLNYNGGLLVPSHYRIPGKSYPAWEYEDLAYLSTVWAAVETEADWDCTLVGNLLGLEEIRADRDSHGERWRSEPYCDFIQIGKGPPTGEGELVHLGCRGQVNGRVFLVTPGMPEPGQLGHWEVAPSFAAFLAMLTDYDPDHIRAIKSGDANALRSCLAAGGDPNQLYRGMSLLAYGVYNSQPEAVGELLARGALISTYLLVEAEHLGCREVSDLLRAHPESVRAEPRGAP